MPNAYYVYQLRLETSEKPFYIGKGCGYRMGEHFRPSSLAKRSHKNHVINKAIREGVGVSREILFQNLTESEAHAKEIELIAFYGRRVNGGCLTNATDGGEGSSGYKPSRNAIERTAASKRGIPRSDATKAKLSEAASKRQLSAETKKKIAKSNSGKTRNDQQKTNIRFGKWDSSPEWRGADALFDAWISAGKPGRTRFQALFGGMRVENIQRAFAKGWNPGEDSKWQSYMAL